MPQYKRRIGALPSGAALVLGLGACDLPGSNPENRHTYPVTTHVVDCNDPGRQSVTAHYDREKGGVQAHEVDLGSLGTLVIRFMGERSSTLVDDGSGSEQQIVNSQGITNTDDRLRLL